MWKFFTIESGQLFKITRIVEKSFKIKIKMKDSRGGITVDFFCKNLIDKLSDKNTTDSINDKVYDILAEKFKTKLAKTIYPADLMTELIQSQRKRFINNIEQDLNIKIDCFKTKRIINYILGILSLSSLVLLVFNTLIGGVCLGIIIITNFIVTRSSSEFKMLTFREFTDKIARENYLRFKNNNGYLNKTEVYDNILSIIADVTERPKGKIEINRYILWTE